MSYAYESMGSAIKRGYFQMPTAIRWIMTATVIGYVVQIFVPLIFGLDPRFFVEHFGFLPTVSATLTEPWRLVSYLFLHGGFFHLAFNMLWLWWMGQMVEQVLGPRVFSIIYFGAGIGGALINLMLTWIWPGNLTIGASGAVFGIMVVFAKIYPTMPIQLFLLPPLEARFVVAGLIAFDIIMQTSGTGGNTARLVHLGGALVGWILISGYYKGLNLDRWFKGWSNPLKKKPVNRSPKNKSMRSVSDAVIIKEADPSELDRILDKIAQSGYDGLTPEEKKTLFELSRRNP